MILCPWKDLSRYAPAIPGLGEAMEKVDSLTTFEPAVYPLSGGNRVVVMQGTTLPADGGEAEAHRQYLDIQYVISGQEVVGWAPLDKLTPTVPFDAEKDVGFYSGEYEYIRIAPGYCYVVFPEDAHLPSRHLETANEYTKIVVKLKV